MNYVEPTALRFHKARLVNLAFHNQAADLCLQMINTTSKDLSFISSFLPKKYKADAAVLYAWCRRIYEIINHLSADERSGAIERLNEELDAIYQKKPSLIITENNVLAAFREMVRRRKIPRYYPQEFLEGIKMDILGKGYPNIYTLYKYCFRISSVIGLMLCHVVGIRDSKALNHIAHMGIAIQLTRICGEIRKDWKNNRLYLPIDMLKEQGSDLTLSDRLKRDSSFNSHYDTFITSLEDVVTMASDQTLTEVQMPTSIYEPSKSVVVNLLKLAEIHYRLGFNGLKYLPWRASLSIDSAALMYRSMGRKLVSGNFDVYNPKPETSSMYLGWLTFRSAVGGGLRYLFTSICQYIK